jgi:hypothetical protein
MIRRLLPFLLCLPLAAADPHMTDAERTKVLNWLEESRKEFLAAIDGVTEAQWKWKPAPEKWSVGECAEHVVISEADLFANIRKALAAPAEPMWEKLTNNKTAMIEYAMAPRLGRVQAPEKLVPTGKLTLAEVRERFLRQREEITKFARDTTDPIKEHVLAHPFPIFDPLNGYQWLIYIPLHTMRHDKQIAEVKGTAGYPAALVP